MGANETSQRKPNRAYLVDPGLPFKEARRTFRRYLLIFGVPTLFLVGWMLDEALFSADARNWQQVPAELTSLDVATVQTRGRQGVTTSYQVVGTYSYEYKGQRFRGTRVSLDDGHEGTPEEARARLVTLRDRRPQVAFVKPSDPTTSSLDTTATPRILKRAVLVGVLVLFLWIMFSPVQREIKGELRTAYLHWYGVGLVQIGLVVCPYFFSDRDPVSAHLAIVGTLLLFLPLRIIRAWGIDPTVPVAEQIIFCPEEGSSRPSSRE